ncbi:MAG: MAE_28990/MAE_18760 family HEPN-like nuclease, partial [Dehalococcoidia bacterium]
LGRLREAVLFAAIAVEIILENYCKTLLKTGGNLSDEQCDALLNRRSLGPLIDLVKTLSQDIDKQQLKELKHLASIRNDIAHGKKRSVSIEEALEAIRATEHLLEQVGDQITQTE